MIMIFHVPLFAKWLREVQQAGVRVQMIIDAPDDLEQLQSPPGLKEAVVHAGKVYDAARVVGYHAAALIGCGCCSCHMLRLMSQRAQTRSTRRRCGGEIVCPHHNSDETPWVLRCRTDRYT
jgi:hypothetical protein